MLTRNGQYYLYGTRGATCWGPADGFDVYVSRDLENWDGPFECFHNDGTFWADRNYWAPEVHEYHGKLYMLASFKREDLCRGTAILTADNPLGPFVPHSDGRVTPSNWECLDGTLYVSPDDKPYLVFAHEWVQVGDGEICDMHLSDDLSRAIGEPKLLFHASEAEWARLVHHRSSGRDGYVTDGPSMWRTADGTLLCLWASFSDEGYTEGVAISDNPARRRPRYGVPRAEWAAVPDAAFPERAFEGASVLHPAGGNCRSPDAEIHPAGLVRTASKPPAQDGG